MTNPFLAGLRSGFKPRARLTLSQWAESGRFVLPADTSSAVGPYRIGAAVYQRGMLDAITNPDVTDIVFVTSSQVGKTTIMAAAQMYYAEYEPCPQLSVWPNDKLSDEYYDEKFSKFVQESSALRKIFDGTAYPGGVISFVGANNPRDLAARSIRVVTGDELDRWPQSAGKEGSPVDLAEKRTATFKGHAKRIYTSTPVLERTSTISAQFRLTHQHYYHVVCPDCGHAQVLQWEQVKYDKGEEHKAVYLCEGEDCGSLWSDLKKRQLVADAELHDGGGWRVLARGPWKTFHADSRPAEGKWGFHISELYSPWSSLGDMAQAESDAGENAEKKKTFANTRLGLPWKGDVSSFADVESLQNRREPYSPLFCPRMAALITASIDVQDDRLELLVVAWGVGDECWVLNHERIDLDPSTPRAWLDATEMLQRRYPHPSGVTLGIEAVCIDSGGHFTQQVYAFSMRNMKLGRRWYAIRGVPGTGKPLWRLSEEKLKKGVKLWLVGVDDGKTTIYSRYAIPTAGPGFVHLHKDVTDDQTKQMTAEIAEVDYDKNGFEVRTWGKAKRSDRNEMLDLMVYNLAARSSLNIDIDRRLQELTTPAPDKTPTMEEVGRMYR